MSLSNYDLDLLQLVPGSIPSTVRWLRLNRKNATRTHHEQELSTVLSPSTGVVLWPPPEMERTVHE